jgi:ribosomal-protein-alanine N-acetyltransferase
MNQLTSTQIRMAEPGDAASIHQLESSCFAEPWSLRAIDGALHDTKYCVVVAQINDAVVGFELGWSVGDEGEIARVGVLPEFRKRGLASQLLMRTLVEMERRAVTEMFLEVRSSNLAAIALYLHCGFQEIGTRPKYYSDGEDALLMHRSLKPQALTLPAMKS